MKKIQNIKNYIKKSDHQIELEKMIENWGKFVKNFNNIYTEKESVIQTDSRLNQISNSFTNNEFPQSYT
jgi:hypothetical protein